MIVRVRLRQMPDHFVGIHVGRRSTAGLENVDHELIVVLARRHFFGGLLDGRREIGRQLTEPSIHARSRALDQPQRADERSWKTQPADRKIFNRALRLRSVKRIRRNAHFTHRVPFDAVFHDSRPATAWLSNSRWYRRLPLARIYPAPV